MIGLDTQQKAPKAMSVVRNTQAASLLREAIVLDLGDLRRQAEEMRRKAHREAQEVISEARAQAQQIIADAARQGREQGRAAGYEEGLRNGTSAGIDQALRERRQQLDQLAEGLKAALDDIEGARLAILSDARVDVLKLSLLLTEKIVLRIVEADPTVVEDQIAEALGLVSLSSRPTLRIHPDLIARVNECLPDLSIKFAAAREMRIVPDDSVTPGGCVLSTEDAEVDAALETQLRRLVEALLPAPDSAESANQLPPDSSALETRTDSKEEEN